MSIPRRIALCAIAGCVALSLGAVAWARDSAPFEAVSSRESPRATSQPVEADSEVNDNIPAVAAQLFSLAGTRQGFGGIETDYPRRSVTLFWVGEPPQEIRDFAASDPRGVHVMINTSANYDLAAVKAARTRVMGSPLRARWGIVTASASRHGLDLGMTRAHPLSAGEMHRLREVAAIDHVVVEPHVPTPRGYGD